MRVPVAVSVSLMTLLVVTAALCGPGQAVAPFHADDQDACCGVMYCSIAALRAADVEIRLSPHSLQAGMVAAQTSTYRPPAAPPPEPPSPS